MTNQEKRERIAEVKYKLRHGFTEEESMDELELAMRRYVEQQELIDSSSNVVRLSSRKVKNHRMGGAGESA
jgi:hypothetical protein